MFKELGHWYAVKDGDRRATTLYERHYSAVNIKARRRTRDPRICGPGDTVICEYCHGTGRVAKR